MPQSQLSGVEVRHLQALQSVVEEGTFRAAAERLGYTQGSVSAQIGALEQMVGTALLDRGPGRPVRLTAAGQAFYGHALDAVARLRAGADEAEVADRGHGAPRLRLGTFPSVASRLLPPLLRRLLAVVPDADVALTESTQPEDLEAAVEAGQLDLTFTVQPFARAGVDGVALLEDPFCLLVRADSELGRRGGPLLLDDLAEQALVLSGNCPHLRHLEAQLALRGRRSRAALHTDDDGLVHELVAAGLGVGVVARLQVDARREDLRALELRGDLPGRIVALAWARDRPLAPLAEQLRAWATARPRESSMS